MLVVKRKDFKYKGFGIKYAHVITDEDEIIKGGGLFLFDKNCMTIAIANTLWVNEADKPYWCRIEKGVLYFFNASLSFKGR